MSRLMEPMFTTRGTRGHRGLGLTITHTIVRDHGGSLEVHSRPGEGAEFSIILPALPAHVKGPNAAGGTAAQLEATPVDTPALPDLQAHGESILLIEDEPTLRTAISRFLRSSGYSVDVADNGSVALDLLNGKRFDLILLDLRMKGITGEDVYETMQATHPDQATKVVFMTGDLHSSQASRFIRLTGRPVLAKPFTLAELAQRVHQLLAAQ
jgi:CheY-like chemotaxis protein